jgi:hypothetical protein
MPNSHNKTHVTKTPDTSHIKNIDVTHEKSDVEIGGIARFVVGLTVLTVAVCLLMWGMFRLFNAEEAKQENQTKRSPMALKERERLPPEPRLQSAPAFGESLERATPEHQAKGEAPVAEDPNRPKDPLWEIQKVREQWNDVLEYGPVDQNGRRYGMPIEKAKEEILKQLPVKKQ